MRFGPLVAAFAACVSLAVAGVATAAPLRVALLPVVVNSNTDEVNYLSSGLADMLSARLEQSGEIAVVRLDEGSTDRDEAVEAATEAGAAFVVYGSYTQFGNGASLDLRCAPVQDESEDDPRRVFIQAGSPSEIIPQLDELSNRMTLYLVGAAVSAAAPAAASAPTSDGNATQTARLIRDLQDRIAVLEGKVFGAPSVSADLGEGTTGEGGLPEPGLVEAAPELP